MITYASALCKSQTVFLASKLYIAFFLMYKINIFYLGIWFAWTCSQDETKSK